MRSAEFARLSSFVAVADSRSFCAAAVREGISPSALSRTVRRIEESLGVRLFSRTTRSVCLTEASESLYARLVPAAAELEGAVRDTAAQQAEPDGVVKLNLPKLAADLILAPNLGPFSKACPGIRLELTIDDGLTDVVAQGFDAGIRIGERLARDMAAVRLTADFRLAAADSPDHFRERQVPQSPHDLREHALPELSLVRDRAGSTAAVCPARRVPSRSMSRSMLRGL